MGHPARVILQEETRAEWVIIGQKGEHAEMMGDMIGSNADRIARNSIKPCMITGPAFAPIKRILVAYDGSGHASQALHVSVELAQPLDIPLVAVIVRESGAASDPDTVAADCRKLCSAHGHAVDIIIRDGEPANAILEEAAAHQCNLVLVGAHGHGRIHEMLLGSTPTQLVTRSDWPVVLVR
jgi:nucleotide-binding universal stress UspA family protein